MGAVIWSLFFTFNIGCILAATWLYAAKYPMRMDIIAAGGLITLCIHLLIACVRLLIDVNKRTPR